MSKPFDPREAAARALCRREGRPENITFEGKPMWQSYLDVVDTVLEAIKPEPVGRHAGQEPASWSDYTPG
ncbi:hypothetical protein [Bosea sp. BIWAKO-01]|uniref:hypothetical protein n=1 Tax=Bosea sp. BIWAKO-01 TaxID=506668 RepID=UPI00114CA9CE|nr:hypothetical protein [Bosea sp. BIWAKO-01]